MFMPRFSAKLDRMYSKYLLRMETLLKDKDAADYLNAIKTSPNHELAQVSRLESRKFDLKWIDDLEKGVEALDRIVRDPKRFLKNDEVIVPIELARKITSDSVIHLSSHTQFIRDIDDNGDVIPNKILTIRREDDFAIYENRFVRTLIERLIIFMEKRYEYIEKYANTRDSDVLTMKSKVESVNGATIEYEAKIKISVPSSESGNAEANNKLLERIVRMREKIRFYANCDFMKILKESKPVGAPILRTNIIMKNTDYQTCYKLWLFIDSYDKLGFSIDVKETNAQFDQRYLNELYQMMLISTMTLDSNLKSQIDFAGSRKVRKFNIKPRIKKFLLDEFIDEMVINEKIGLGYGGIGGRPGGQAYDASMSLDELIALKQKEKLEHAKELKRLAAEKAKENARLAREKERQQREEKRQRELEKSRAKALEQKAREAEKFARKRAELEEKRRIAEEEKRRLTLIEDEKIRLREARERVLGFALKDKPLEETKLNPKTSRFITREEFVEEIVYDDVIEDEFNPDDYIEVDYDSLEPGEYEVVDQVILNKKKNNPDNE